MSETLFVVNSPARWPVDIEGVSVVAARDYLSDAKFAGIRHARVLNLCRSYSYQSTGYYVSLLAEARGHRPLPSVATIQDTKSLSILRLVGGDLDALINKSLSRLQSDEFDLSIYFGRNVAKHYDRVSRELFNLFPAPLLRAHFRKTDGQWALQNISIISASEVPKGHWDLLPGYAKQFFNRPRFQSRRARPRYYMAILYGGDKMPPSDPKALERFSKAAAGFGISTEVIGRDDYGRLGEFDALFIRETTAVNHHTYRFARRAEADGLVVIDDPQSIVRCANKVFLAELFERFDVPAPKTLIVHKDNYKEISKHVGLPCVLKQPDSSFSQGVEKAATEEEVTAKALAMLEKSDLVIAQAYLPTDFDWRIGILDGKPLYACKYYMARGHWQIYNHSETGNDYTGKADTLPVEVAPRRVVKAALKAARLIGDGLYGVDVKEIDGRPYVVEVNDNPSIDSGVEDAILREALYERIMECFLRRLDSRRDGPSGT